MAMDPKNRNKAADQLLERLKRLEQTPSVAEQKLRERLSIIEQELDVLEDTEGDTGFDDATLNNIINNLRGAKSRSMQRLASEGHARSLNVSKRFMGMVNQSTVDL
jgi:hypothetical protein